MKEGVEDERSSVHRHQVREVLFVKLKYRAFDRERHESTFSSKNYGIHWHFHFQPGGAGGGVARLDEEPGRRDLRREKRDW